MNDHETHDSRDDRDLHVLLHDAVSDVHPRPALAAIRSRTGERARGPRVRVAALAAAATAAGIVGVTVAVQQSSGRDDPGPVASSPTPAASPSTAASPSGAQLPGTSRTLGIYFVGDTPQGPRLYREFHRLVVTTPGNAALGAVGQALDHATDADYRSPWPDGSQVVRTQVPASGPLSVSLANAQVDLRIRPAGMSAAEANEAVQQLVYTAQAAIQDRRPVHFQLRGRDTDRLLGVDVSGPVANQPPLDVLALVSISDPGEGAVVRGSFRASGVASSFEANVPWQIRKGTRVVASGFSTASGWTDRLYPWQTDAIDVSGLAEGTYTFVAMTDDPSAGEGPGPEKDTRTIVVRR